MTAFSILKTEVGAGEPWADEYTVDAFWSREENATIELRHRTAGYQTTGAAHTRWLCDAWIVYLCPLDSEPKLLQSHEFKEDAADHFKRARAQLG